MEQTESLKQQSQTISHNRTNVPKQIGGDDQPQTVKGMIGQSPQMRSLAREIARAARSQHGVLITGETGTGKTTAARATHDQSPRSSKPFVEGNCAAIPETLLEAELFGYERGAFTGAVTSKRGQFEEADGGTLFLDEVGELTLGMQAKMLKAIEEKSIRRLGGVRATKCNVRIIAATSQLLPEMIRDKRFREDLYYRLEVLQINTCPLRERRADIPALVEHRLREEQQQMGRSPPFEIEAAAIKALQAYEWPGNIRQLQNIIAKITTYTEGTAPLTIEEVLRALPSQMPTERATHPAEAATTITPPTTAHLQLVQQANEREVALPDDILKVREDETLKQYIARVKICAIEAAREQAADNMFGAARRLGVAYTTLNQVLRKAREIAA